ncbi:MAG TPA: AMP-binding protein [Gemmatimonadaceae bacterium]|nr:AMP-binding protein [Gemmatimonadaceae bacterium]
MTTFPWLSSYDAGIPDTLEPYPSRTLLDYLHESATQWPERPALLFKGATIDYATLERLSDNFGVALHSLGVKKGDRVALGLPNCPQFLIAELGAWKIGAIVCPFNPLYSEREMEDALNATGAETAVVLNRTYYQLKSVQPRTHVHHVIATNIKEYLPFKLRLAYTFFREKKEGDRIDLRESDKRFAELVAGQHRVPPANLRAHPDDPSIVLMSGGTTGTPKGVVGTHHGMVVAGMQLKTWLSPAMVEWSDTIMLPLPLFHVYANVGVQALALMNHNPVALIPNPREMRDVLQEINTVSPAFICAVPTLLIGLMSHPLTRDGKVNWTSIKLCFSGAAALMAETQKKFEELTGGVIVEGYSLTEAQMAVVANPVRGEKKLGSVGLPLPDVEVRILDAEDGVAEIPQGDVGEIVIRAPQLMQGYWERPDETAEMIRTGKGGERLLFTGDLGYLDSQGYLFIVDRKKDLIKTSGYQVWPREIEEVISTHPAVKEVGVAGLPDKMRGEKAKAWIVLHPGQRVSQSDIKTYCRERLVPYKVPSQFEFVDELPKSAAGKVLRRKLRERETEKVNEA